MVFYGNSRVGGVPTGGPASTGGLVALEPPCILQLYCYIPLLSKNVILELIAIGYVILLFYPWNSQANLLTPSFKFVFLSSGIIAGLGT